MSNWETFKTEEVEGFTITLATAPEDDSPEGHFASGDDEADEEVIRKIENGTYLWFMVRVEASKAGIVLGTDYLGGCCYADVGDFITSDGYYPDMVREAIADAKRTMEQLAPAYQEMRAALTEWEKYGINNGGDENYTFLPATRAALARAEEWSGSPCPEDPDNYWIDDKTGERIPAK